jgi:hypothetical protein
LLAFVSEWFSMRVITVSLLIKKELIPTEEKN